MKDLFEIGELGFLRDIPAELSSKIKENIFLKTQIHGQQNKIHLLGILLMGISAYWVWNKYHRYKNTSNEDSTS